MSKFGDNCKYIFRHIRDDYLNPYLKKLKGVNSPVKVWSFGNLNEDKIIYLITDISTKRSGIYSMYLTILSELSYAKMMGWVPVIDNTHNLLRKNIHRKKGNIITDFFQLNNAVTVEDALKSKNVILCNINKKINMLMLIGRADEIYKIGTGKSFFDIKEEEISYWREFAHKNLKYKQEIEKKLNEEYFNVIQGRKNVLSVAVREGKMALSSRTRRISVENEQPSIQLLLEITKHYFIKWNCEYIYLSCEALETVEMFKREFGEDIILVLERFRLPLEELLKIRDFRSGDKFMKRAKSIPNYDMDYIKDMYILSKGDYLICPDNRGTEAAFIMNDGFKMSYCIK